MENTNAAPQTNGNGKRKKAMLLAAAIFGALGVAYGAYWGVHGRYFESTDDAYVAGNVVQVTPQVAGTVIAIRAEQPYAIKGHVENGVLRWVFNVASNPDSPHRDLRFWTRELSLFASNQREHHAVLRNTDVKFAVDKIIGTRHTFRTNDVCLLFNLTRPALAALRNELRPDDNRHYSRERLEQFLIRRLLK